MARINRTQAATSLSREQLLQRVSLSNPVHLLAFGFGSGLASKAPGTFGSIAAIPLIAVAAMYGNVIFGVVALLIAVVGIWVCQKATVDLGVHDHASIVWDEISGMFIAFIAVPISVPSVLLGLVLFRCFDILKPWPVSWADKRVNGGLGIMLDDWLAGAMTLACLHLTTQLGLLT